MTTIALDEESSKAHALIAAHTGELGAHERPSGLVRASIVYCLVEAVSAWGWMHWRADLPSLAPPLAVASLMRSAALLVFVSAVSQASVRAPTDMRARDAACMGWAALLLHAPWTLVVVKWPYFTWVWLACMCAVAVAATAKLERDRFDAALVAAPYTGWLVAALYVETMTHGPLG